MGLRTGPRKPSEEHWHARGCLDRHQPAIRGVVRPVPMFPTSLTSGLPDRIENE